MANQAVVVGGFEKNPDYLLVVSDVQTRSLFFLDANMKTPGRDVERIIGPSNGDDARGH